MTPMSRRSSQRMGASRDFGALWSKALQVNTLSPSDAMNAVARTRRQLLPAWPRRRTSPTGRPPPGHGAALQDLGSGARQLRPRRRTGRLGRRAGRSPGRKPVTPLRPADLAGPGARPDGRLYVTRPVFRVASTSPCYNYDDLTGKGAEMSGGRWNRKGVSTLLIVPSVIVPQETRIRP